MVCMCVCMPYVAGNFCQEKNFAKLLLVEFLPTIFFIDYMATLTALMKIYSTDMLCISANAKVAVLGKSFFL